MQKKVEFWTQRLKASLKNTTYGMPESMP